MFLRVFSCPFWCGLIFFVFCLCRNASLIFMCFTAVETSSFFFLFLFSCIKSIILSLPKKNAWNYCFFPLKTNVKSLITLRHCLSDIKKRHHWTEKDSSRTEINFKLHRKSQTVSDSINSVREEELLLLYFVPSQSFNESFPLVQLLFSSAKILKQISHLFLTFRKKKSEKVFYIWY